MKERERERQRGRGENKRRGEKEPRVFGYCFGVSNLYLLQF